MDKFTKQYSKGDSRNIGKAFRLKNRNMPQKLYQYRSIETTDGVPRFERLIDVLQTGRLYCSTNENLNDPLDLQTILSTENPSVYINSVASVSGNNEYKSYYWSIRILKPFLKRLFRKNGIPEVEIESFDSSVNDIFLRWVDELKSMHNDFLGLLRIVCFTETFDNLPMWWFYTDERRGVCLEFDVEKLQSGVKLFVFPVKYTDNLPDVIRTLHKLDTRRVKRMSEKEKEFFVLFSTGIFPCTHKLSDWSYEKEWRYIMLNAENVDFVIPSKIILGDRIDDVKKDEICKVAKTQGIRVTQMKITKFGFDEHEVDHPC
jgi:hypothetical protein